MSWHQYVYAASLIVAVFRAARHWKRCPFFLFWLVLALPTNLFSLPLFSALCSGVRALSCFEAYAELTIARSGEPPRPWSPGSMLLGTACLMAMAGTLIARSFAGQLPDYQGLLEFRRYLTIWNGLWIFIALLFFALWGDWRGRKWGHCLTVAGISWLRMAGSLAKLHGIADGDYLALDCALTLASAALLGIWAIPW